MRVALVNPNRYLEPPVIPVGIEYLAHYLERAGHEVMVTDLSFAADPEEALTEALRSFDPQVAGFSLRNLDTSLYFDNVFLLDTSAALIAACRRACGATVVAGGSALLAGPREVMDYLGCDFAVYGPGELAFPALLRDLERGAPPPRIVDGWDHSFDPTEVPTRGRWIDYAPYLAQRGIAGFATQVGCMGKCSFCVEAGLPWRPRDPRAVVEEVAALRELGCAELHLCDCEFNQDLDMAKRLLTLMQRAELGVGWSLYMKPLPHDGRLFSLLASTGASAVTLSVDSRSIAAGAYGPADLRSFIALARQEGIKVAVDLLVGFPGERREEARDVIACLADARPDTVGVSAWIRVFKYTQLGRAVRAGSPPLRVEGGDPDLLKPAYYEGYTLEECRGLIAGDPIFRIEGLERRSNYERLSRQAALHADKNHI